MGSTVVVVGGGYGGTLVAKELDASADVVLIDPREAFVNAAASLRALTRPEWASNAFFPYQNLLARGRVIRDRAVSADPGGVTLASGARVDADHLVLATGSGYSYPAKPHPASTSVDQQLADLWATHHELAGAGRVLIAGAGPVGLELAGEIRDVWPDKHVTVVDRGSELLPGFLPEVREALHRRLAGLGIELRLNTGPVTLPEVEAGRAGDVAVTVAGTGEVIEADIWFRAFGVRVNTAYLTDGRLTALTRQATVPVDERLTVAGHDHVYAVGDITDLPDPKMASYAMVHAAFVARAIKARIDRYRPAPERRILLPLGPWTGVGQLPTPDGVAVAGEDVVRQRKGADLFTARFAARFDVTARG